MSRLRPEAKPSNLGSKAEWRRISPNPEVRRLKPAIRATKEIAGVDRALLAVILAVVPAKGWCSAVVPSGRAGTPSKSYLVRGPLPYPHDHQTGDRVWFTGQARAQNTRKRTATLHPIRQTVNRALQEGSIRQDEAHDASQIATEAPRERSGLPESLSPAKKPKALPRPLWSARMPIEALPRSVERLRAILGRWGPKRPKRLSTGPYDSLRAYPCSGHRQVRPKGMQL